MNAGAPFGFGPNNSASAGGVNTATAERKAANSKTPTLDQYGRDLTADRLLRVIDRMYFVWVALGFAIPYAIGYSIELIGR